MMCVSNRLGTRERERERRTSVRVKERESNPRGKGIRFRDGECLGFSLKFQLKNVDSCAKSSLRTISMYSSRNGAHAHQEQGKLNWKLLVGS